MDLKAIAREAVIGYCDTKTIEDDLAHSIESALRVVAIKCAVMARMAGHENLENIIKKEFGL